MNNIIFNVYTFFYSLFYKLVEQQMFSTEKQKHLHSYFYWDRCNEKELAF